MAPLSVATGPEELHKDDQSLQWTILIVDDHPLVRMGMSFIFSQEPGLKVMGECATVEQALQAIETCPPHLVVVDISLQDSNGMELIKLMSQQYSKIKILVCSMHDETLFAERCLRAGADGYLSKEAASSQILEAIQKIREGKTYVSPALAEQLLNRIVGGGSSQQSPIETLTDRELEVFGLIGQGLTTRQISERLHLSYKTIESYRENIKAKLSLKNAAELSRHAVKWALEIG